MSDLFDRHGFKILEDQSPSKDDDYCKCTGNLSSPDRNGDDWRTNMWEQVIEDWEENQTRLEVKLHTLLKQGVPQSVRSQLWKKLLDVETLKASDMFDYKEQLSAVRAQLAELGLCEYGGPEMLSHLVDLDDSGTEIKAGGKVSGECYRQIMLDLDRSFPSNKKFLDGTAEGKEGRAALCRLLASYARYNPKVGYCQGMSYVAGMLLMQLEEEDAFWCFVSLMERRKYLRGFYSTHMLRLKRYCEMFERLLKARHPNLHAHLDNLGAQPLLYLTPWFLCLFTSLPCWDTVLAAWDLFLLDGMKAIFRTALAMMEQVEDTVLNTKDFSKVMSRLLHPETRRICVIKFMPVVWTIKMDDKEMLQLENAVMCQDKKLGKKRDRRALLDSPCVVENIIKTKRQRLDREIAPSLFRRIVNIFTPKEQRLQLGEKRNTEQHDESTKIPTARRRITHQMHGAGSHKPRCPGASGKALDTSSGLPHLSPCQEVKEENLKFASTGALLSKDNVQKTQSHNSPRPDVQKRKIAHACHRREASVMFKDARSLNGEDSSPSVSIMPLMGHI